MADPFLDGKPMKLSKNGSDMVCVFLGFFFFFFFFLHFMTVLAAAFCSACRRLISFGGSPDRRLLQEPSFDKIRQTAMLLAAL